jgi:putative phosphoserine phosphatase/1-acylglycerol-3-phosphate O-acyltransferase
MASPTLRSPGSSSRRTLRIGAFFDMDKTLIAENSGAVYMKHRFAEGEISSWELLRGVGDYLRYKLGVLDIGAWARTAMREMEGRSEAEVAAEGLGIYRDQIADLVYPRAREIVRHHLDEGHVVAIVSGATRYVVEPLARDLGVEHSLYTRLEVVSGRFTGRVIEPLCFEEGKIYWLHQFIEDHQIDLARSWFYTDSVTDLPLLDLVGHPIVVNPDPLLYRTAVRRRWPVQIYDEPGGGSASARVDAEAG